jgi:hypothetical protein
MAGTVRWDPSKLRLKARTASKNIAHEKAELVKEMAFTLCPKDTGNLANSIHTFETAHGWGVRATGAQMSQLGLSETTRNEIEARGPIKIKLTRLQRELGDPRAGTKSSEYKPRPTRLEALASLKLSTRLAIQRRGEIKVVKTGHRHNYARAVELGSPTVHKPFLLRALKNVGGR